MGEFSNNEYYDMILCVGATLNSDIAAARRLYFERFIEGRPPNEQRRLPSYDAFRSLTHRLQSTGSFHVRREGRPSTRTRAELEERILQHVSNDPRTSTRRTAALLNTNHMAVWRTLSSDHQHPYHFRKSQELVAADFIHRVRFCNWYRSRAQADPNFSSKVLWSDEASFTRGGMSNVHNEHIWAHENPHASRESSFQHQWRINVWAGIIGDHLIGPVFLPDSLNGQNYLEFLITILEDALEDMPLRVYRDVIFQHDGAPAHFARQVRQYLDARFPVWIGRHGPVAWPPRSPDLTVLDFFLWGHVKNLVYAHESQTRDTMQAKITAAFDTITVEMLRNVQRSTMRRVSLCIDHHGGHFEAFL